MCCGLCCRQSEIVPFFTILEEDRDVADMILDYSISQTTLEEVFLNVGQVSIATHTEKQYAWCIYDTA